MAFNKNNLYRTARDYVFITFGMAIYAFGFCGFILPERVVIGGLAGVGTIVYFLTGIPVGITQYACNLLLLALAYKIVGKKFVLGTIYGATMISVFVSIFQPLLEGGFTNDSLTNVVIGGAMAGVGIGVAFTHNGSSGGTDIIAAMVQKYTNVSIGRTMLCNDCIIISSSYFLFHQIDKVVYGFIVLLLSAYVADLVVNKMGRNRHCHKQRGKTRMHCSHRHGLVLEAGSEGTSGNVPQNRICDYLANNQIYRPRCIHHAVQCERCLWQRIRRTEGPHESTRPSSGSYPVAESGCKHFSDTP